MTEEECVEEFRRRTINPNSSAVVYIQMFLKRLHRFGARFELVHRVALDLIELESDICALCKKKNDKKAALEHKDCKVMLRIFCMKCTRKDFVT